MSAIRVSPPSTGLPHDGKEIGKEKVTYVYRQVSTCSSLIHRPLIHVLKHSPSLFHHISLRSRLEMCVTSPFKFQKVRSGRAACGPKKNLSMLQNGSSGRTQPSKIRFFLLVLILLLWLTHLHGLCVLNAVKVFGRGRENLNAISIWSLWFVGSSSCIPVWWHGE